MLGIPLLPPMKTVLRLALCLGIASLLLAASPVQAKDRPPSPAWTMNDLDGKPVYSADFKGKVVLLNFWATWCPPCRAEIPDLIALQKAYGPRGLQIVGASVDEGGPAVVKSFAAANKINYPMVMATAEVTMAYGNIEAIPTTFVIDAQGRPVKSFVGAINKAEIEKLIAPLLPKADAK